MITETNLRLDRRGADAEILFILIATVHKCIGVHQNYRVCHSVFYNLRRMLVILTFKAWNMMA